MPPQIFSKAHLLWHLVQQYNRSLPPACSALQLPEYAIICDPYANTDAGSTFRHLSFSSILGVCWDLCYDTGKNSQYWIYDEKEQKYIRFTNGEYDY